MNLVALSADQLVFVRTCWVSDPHADSWPDCFPGKIAVLFVFQFNDRKNPQFHTYKYQTCTGNLNYAGADFPHGSKDTKYHFAEHRPIYKEKARTWFILQLVSVSLALFIFGELRRDSRNICVRIIKIGVMILYVLICAGNIYQYIGGDNPGLEACREWVCAIVSSEDPTTSASDCYDSSHAQWDLSLEYTSYACIYGVISTIFAIISKPYNENVTEKKRGLIVDESHSNIQI